jgi:hypothetical protein
MTFIKWSSVNSEAKSTLKPDLGVKSWGEIDQEKKKIIYKHAINLGWFVGRDKEFYDALFEFSNDHKARAFCNHLLGHGGPHSYDHGGTIKDCCYEAAEKDFHYLFHQEHQDVVYELISYYVEQLSHSYDQKKQGRFIRMFNDLSNQFGLNVLLTENSFIFRQEEKITKEIYEPILKYLSDKKWEPVNRELSDAFADYLRNTPECYSSCITHTVSGVQAFLQILVKGSVGKGDISDLVNQGIKNGVIPNDPFSARVFKDLVSILMQERQEKSDSHPKKEYANEKSARLVLNLSMVFMQHSLQG